MKKISETIKGLNVSDLSRFRGEIMGFAIIQVLILHFVQGYNSAHSDVLSVIGMGYIGLTGSVGVDMFAIMSGIGLFYSLSANSAVGQFFKKRFTRVVIPYLIWCPVIFAACALIEPESGFLQDVCYHLFFGSFLFEKMRTFWYVPFALVTYLLAPFAFKGISGKKPGFALMCWLAGTFAVTLILKYTVPEVYSGTLIALHRIPIFFVGMYIGRLAKEKRPITAPMYVLMAVGFVIRLLKVIPVTDPHVSFISQYYILGLFSFFALFVLVVFFKLIDECFLTRFLRSTGKYSFELYITHQGLRFISVPLEFPRHTVWGYAVIMILSVAASLLLSLITDRIAGKKKKSLQAKNQ